MKKFYLLLFFLITACSQQPVFHDVNGNAIKFTDYRGKWVVINYWATWCQPCYKEIPELNNFYRAHHDQDVMMFGVNYDYAPVDQLPSLIKLIGAKFPILTNDPAKELGIKHLSGLPATAIIDPDGKVKEVLFGVQTQSGLETIMGLKANG
jgi:thiol-disulfide isomerase/thioredoxin